MKSGYAACQECGTPCRGTYCLKCYNAFYNKGHSRFVDERVKDPMPEGAPPEISCPQCGATDEAPGPDACRIHSNLWAQRVSDKGSRKFREHRLTGVKVLNRGTYEVEYICMECGKSWEVPRGE